MSLSTIQLPPFVIQQLYKNSLVKIDTENKLENNSSVSNLNVLGKNSKNIIILVSDEVALYLPDEELNFLLGVLTACKLTMDDVGILNVKKQHITYNLFSDSLMAEKIILFDVLPSDIELPLSFPQYQVQQYNKQTYLSASSLSSIMKDDIEKRKLWNCLIKLFSI